MPFNPAELVLLLLKRVKVSIFDIVNIKISLHFSALTGRAMTSIALDLACIDCL